MQPDNEQSVISKMAEISKDILKRRHEDTQTIADTLNKKVRTEKWKKQLIEDNSIAYL